MRVTKQIRKSGALKRRVVGLAIALVLVGAIALQPGLRANAQANDGCLRWKEIIGIIQTGNTVGSGTGKVTGGLFPWHTTRGKAAVNLATGDLHFVVRGLVFAGGNSIGTRADVAQVKGTLVCDTLGSATGNSTLVDTDFVPLSLEGDARFSGNVGPLPDACLNSPNIAFLIRSQLGFWIANGSVRVFETPEEEEEK